MTSEMMGATAEAISVFDRLGRVGPSTLRPWKDTVSHQISLCENCHRTLSWPTPRPGMWAAPVPCPKCQHIYFTLAKNRSRVALAVSDEDDTLFQECEQQKTVAAVQAAAKLLSALFTNAPSFRERRRAIRYQRSAPVVAVPLGIDGAPIGEAYSLTLLNISAGGLGLMRRGKPIDKYLLIDFAVTGAPGFQCYVCVRWNDESDGITRVGTKFLTPSI